MEQKEYMEVDDVRVFEVLNNPTRFRILTLLDEPKSIKDIAELLDVPPTRLYYHFNLMEETGVVAVAETRKVGAILQRLYQSTAKGFRPSPDLARGEYEPREVAKMTTGVVLDGARADSEEALTGHFERLRAGEDKPKLLGTLGRSVTHMSRERAEEYLEKIEALMTDFADADDSGEIEYAFTVVLFPLAGSVEAKS